MFTTVFISEIIVKKKKKRNKGERTKGVDVQLQLKSSRIMSLLNSTPGSVRMRVFSKKPARLVLSLAWLVERAISYSGAFPWSGFSWLMLSRLKAIVPLHGGGSLGVSAATHKFLLNKVLCFPPLPPPSVLSRYLAKSTRFFMGKLRCFRLKYWSCGRPLGDPQGWWSNSGL